MSACTRLVAFNAFNTAATWFFTVPSARPSSRQITLLDLPSRTSHRTSICRGVRPSCAAVPSPWCARAGASACAAGGAPIASRGRYVPPESTRRSALRITGEGEDLGMKPSAPRSNAPRTSAASSSPDIITTGTSGKRSWKSTRAANPVTSGMRKSSSTRSRSGFSSAICSARSYRDASSTSISSPSCWASSSSTGRSPSRISSWSSMTRIFTGCLRRLALLDFAGPRGALAPRVAKERAQARGTQGLVQQEVSRVLRLPQDRRCDIAGDEDSRGPGVGRDHAADHVDAVLLARQAIVAQHHVGRGATGSKHLAPPRAPPPPPPPPPPSFEEDLHPAANLLVVVDDQRRAALQRSPRRRARRVELDHLPRFSVRNANGEH